MKVLANEDAAYICRSTKERRRGKLHLLATDYLLVFDRLAQYAFLIKYKPSVVLRRHILASLTIECNHRLLSKIPTLAYSGLFRSLHITRTRGWAKVLQSDLTVSTLEVSTSKPLESMGGTPSSLLSSKQRSIEYSCFVVIDSGA